MEITGVQRNTHIFKYNFPQKSWEESQEPTHPLLIRVWVLEHRMDYMYENKLLLISLLKFLKTIFNGLVSKIDSIGLICQYVTPFVCQCKSIDFRAIMAG